MRLIPPTGRGPVTGPRPKGTYRGPLDEGRPPIAWRYIRLACGCVSTPEQQEFWRLWKPKRGLYFCEHTGHGWVKALTLAEWFRSQGWEPARETTEPMF